ncbi:glycosyltransferase family 4 protein [Hymenobacter busanensis]|uniref:Glycosyltransferase family 4 protein n=1 Tax=Hymenobacter busanensis TaxID=2607656 RepID=A0A7L5A2P7_9BACT|nr:glycosyltransferase family 4 protein [Hymenobacter busanensis]KAA9331580.1 glycosyltransferase family 4 protein [Hymenobacter busanensis]QHJ08732.1 glycosyltransferase [Hymenobacter busanensis]
MHIAVFSQYHTNPDCPATSRHYALLRHIAQHHRVTLISTNTWEAQRLTQQFPWLPEGVELRAADIGYRNDMGIAARGFSFVRYAAYAYQQGLRIDKPDVIWGISTPLTAAWVAAQVAKRRRVPWVFEVQDLWPTFPIEMGAVRNALAQRQLYAAERRLYEQAQHVVTLSPDMSRYVTGLGIPADKVSTVLNGTDLDLAAYATPEAAAALREQQGLQGRPVVLYAGTFGRANDIPTLVQAAEQLHRLVPEAVWLFMGHGYYEPLLREAAGRCPAIRLVPPQPRHAVFTWLAAADVSVASFINLPVLDANSPAKFYDSLAVGTPVVVTNRGWTKQWVGQYRCGWFAPAENAAELAATLASVLRDPVGTQAAGQRGRQVAQAQFDRQQLAATVQQILEQAAG